MYEYNFKEKRIKVEKELETRLAENKDKYYFQLNLFKEENNKYDKNLDFENNKDIKKKKIILKGDSKDLEIDKEYLNLENENNIKFKTYYNKAIGLFEMSSYLIYRDYQNIKFEYTIFKDCNFKDVVFEKCVFTGGQFLGCKFNNVEFVNCEFWSFDYKNSVYFEDCEFINCIFEKSNLKEAIFDKCIIEDIYFVFSNLKKSIISQNTVNSVFFSDCNLKSAALIRNKIKKLEFDDDFLTKLDENTFFDKFITDKEDKNSYNSIYKIYKCISLQFEYNANLNIAGEYHYLYKVEEGKRLNGILKIKSILFWSICGYGERPTYALITSLEIIILFAILYLFTGISVNGKVINYDMAMFIVLTKKVILVDFLEAFYFSLVTFTTVGYGDIVPIGTSIVLSSLEMVLGVTMVGIWTATLARKISR